HCAGRRLPFGGLPGVHAVRFILDTHAFLWFVLNDPQLSAVARQLIAAPGHRLWLSPASFWEIAIKLSTGKYVLQEPFEVFLRRVIQQYQFEILEIKVEHAGRVAMLPFHHRDPFDRMLVAQALVEQVPLISVDPVFDLYGVQRLW